MTLPDNETPVYCHETNSFGHHPTFLGLGMASRERLSHYEVSPYCIGAREEYYSFTPILDLPLH